MIKAVSLYKTYYQNKARIGAVKNVNLEVRKRESILITGPSGAGKSTLLHLLGGLDKPTKGALLLDGVDFYGLPDRERSSIRNARIGFVFQFYHLLPEFTVLENVMLPALIRRQKTRQKYADIKKMAENLLKLVSLTDRAGHRPAELSGGESQRVAIARSLVNSPEVLLCDEPTGNLDSKIGKEIMDCLWAIREKADMALVVVTHDENIHEGFDKKFRIIDGTLEEIRGARDEFKGLPEWEIHR